jgi:hypothetical protein
MLDEYSSLGALLLGAGTLIGAVSTWLLGVRRDSRDTAAAAIEALSKSMVGMRADIDRLRDELAEERGARTAAEAAVRQLRAALHMMADVMHRAGLPLPEVKGLDLPFGSTPPNARN